MYYCQQERQRARRQRTRRQRTRRQKKKRTDTCEVGEYPNNVSCDEWRPWGSRSSRAALWAWSVFGGTTMRQGAHRAAHPYHLAHRVDHELLRNHPLASSAASTFLGQHIPALRPRCVFLRRRRVISRRRRRRRSRARRRRSRVRRSRRLRVDEELPVVLSVRCADLVLSVRRFGCEIRLCARWTSFVCPGFSRCF